MIQAVQDFFTNYPDALDVFESSDGATFLNHFETQAMKYAARNSTTLKRISSNGSETQVYPEGQSLYQYSVTVGNESVDQFALSNNSTTYKMQDTSDQNEMRNAITDLVNAGGFTLDGITITDNLNNSTITIVVGIIGANDMVLQVLDTKSNSWLLFEY